MLDESAPYGEIINDTRGARYEQFGRRFNGSKREIDPQTGAVLDPQDVPETVEPEVKPIEVKPIEAKPIEAKPIAAGPVPDAIEGLDLTDIDLEQAHWQHLKQYLKAFGQEYVDKDEALEYLLTIQKVQRG